MSVAETTAKPMSAPEEENDPLQVLTEAYLGTPKSAEAMPRQSPSHNQCQSRLEVTFAYYPFLCINNISSLHTDDINYLDAQGCFKLPESNSLDHLVRTFFQNAHPILPVVNEAEFWSAYDPSTSGGKTNRVPVILLLAMLFVACKVSPQIITESSPLISPNSMWMMMWFKACNMIPHRRRVTVSFGRPR